MPRDYTDELYESHWMNSPLGWGIQYNPSMSSNNQLALVTVPRRTGRSVPKKKLKAKLPRSIQVARARSNQRSAPQRRGNNTRNQSLYGNARGQNQSNQIGMVMSTRITKTGLSNLRSYRMSWVMGYTYVGIAGSGNVNAVYFLTASQTWIIRGLSPPATGISSGMVPIASSDPDIGQAFNADIEKHFQRKVVKRMWLHVDSLQPSTTNNMMAVIGISRGPGGMVYSIPIAKATVAITPNTVNNVSSMTGSFTVDSWESKSIEISDFIAGGSGARQNEFEISGSPGSAAVPNIYNATTVPPVIDADGLVPCNIGVAGNCTTATLQGTLVHQIVVEQEIDLLDFVGGMNVANVTD